MPPLCMSSFLSWSYLIICKEPMRGSGFISPWDASIVAIIENTNTARRIIPPIRIIVRKQPIRAAMKRISIWFR